MDAGCSRTLFFLLLLLVVFLLVVVGGLRVFLFCGGYGGRVTPGSFSNPVVKSPCADGTAPMVGVGE